MSKISDLTEVTTPSASDQLPLLMNPSGTPVNRKVTIANALAWSNRLTFPASFAYTGSTGVNSDNVTLPGLTAGHCAFEWVGTADWTVTGVAGGTKGQTITIRNSSAASVIHFAHNSSSSTGGVGGNRFANFATTAPTRIGSGGSVVYLYNGTFWLLIAHEQGTWVMPPFATTDFYAIDFTGAVAGTFSVPNSGFQVNKYRLAGKTLSIRLLFAGNTTSVYGIVVRSATWGGYTLTDGTSYLQMTPVITEGANSTAPIVGFGQSLGTEMRFWKSALAIYANTQVNVHLNVTVEVA